MEMSERWVDSETLICVRVLEHRSIPTYERNDPN